MVDAEAERRADRHQQAEQQEGDEDRQQREDRADLLAPQAAPEQRQELHACRASFHQHALVEVQRPLGALGGVRIVRDHDDRLAVIAVERLQQIEDLVAGLAIEIAGRLVGRAAASDR